MAGVLPTVGKPGGMLAEEREMKKVVLGLLQWRGAW